MPNFSKFFVHKKSVVHVGELDFARFQAAGSADSIWQAAAPPRAWMPGRAHTSAERHVAVRLGANQRQEEQRAALMFCT